MRDFVTQPDRSRDYRDENFRVPAAMAYVWSRTNMLKEIWEIVRVLEGWPGVRVVADANGLRLTLGDEAYGRLHWNGRIDLPLNREVRDQLVAEEIVRSDLDYASAEGVVLVVQTRADADRALRLFRLAYLIAESDGSSRTPAVAQILGAQGARPASERNAS